MKLLLSGDLHVGRSSSRVPETVSRDEIRAESAWHRIVALAIQERVDLVCLSGDVADQDNKFWEAIGSLERGIRNLADHDIRTVAVAGNHDYDVLVRLAAQFPPGQFVLLGRGGNWQRLTVEENGQPALHIDGWSFPQQHVYHSPLDRYDLHRDPNVPTLGMVHGDLDVTTTRYAPLDRARLQAAGPSAWLLGHKHAPHLTAELPWVLYPGSPQALDPGETGPHGPWITEVSGGTLAIPVQRPLSSIWYGHHTIDLSDIENEEELDTALIDELRSEAERIAATAGPHLAYAYLRLRLVGVTPLSHRVADIADRIKSELALPAGAGALGVESVDVQTMPAIDLKEYAATRTAPGAIARMLLELESEQVSDEVAQLIRQTRYELEHVEHHKEFAQLDRREVTEQQTRQYLQKQGRALLTQLVMQNQ